MSFESVDDRVPSVEFSLAAQLLEDSGFTTALMEFSGTQPDPNICREHNPLLILYAGETGLGAKPARRRIEHEAVTVLLQEAVR